MAAQKLCQRVHDDVRAMLDGPKQNRCGNRVVDDQRQPAIVSHSRQPFDIADVSCRIADTLAEDGTRLVVDHAEPSPQGGRFPQNGRLLPGSAEDAPTEYELCRRVAGRRRCCNPFRRH